MPWNPTSPAGERLHEKLSARRLLAKMSQAERLAAFAEDQEAEPRLDLRPAEIEFRKARHAGLYRELIGVPIEQRHALRAALAEIAKHGRRQVSDLIAELQIMDATAQSSDNEVVCS